ncbi:MAG: ABC transporter permease [Solirubrobacterales bacterium]|nr:ABC transporter permease [Solirubrobacterales bacterium]
MKFRALLRKDFRMLQRSPSLTILLVLYPIVVAVLMGLAIGRPQTKPTIVISNQVPKEERVVKLGGSTFNLDELTGALYENVDAKTVDTTNEAISAVRRGDAVAAIVIPTDIVDQLTSGTSQGEIKVIYDSSNAVRKSAVETTINGVLAGINRELTSTFRDQTLEILNALVKGGKFDGLGQGGSILGFADGKTLLDRIVSSAPPRDRADVRRLATTMELSQVGIGFADTLLKRIGEPIKLDREPIGTVSSIPALAVAVAACVSMMFVALLLGAGTLALEQEDRMLSRLLRGLLSRTTVVVEKVTLSAICASLVGLLMLAGFSIFLNIQWDRSFIWIPAVVAGAVGLSAAGVAIGALMRDVRAASLVAFMVGLPLAAAALVPSDSVGTVLGAAIAGVSALFPFKPAFDLLSAGLTPDGEPLLPLLHLAVLSVVYGAIAVAAVRRYQYA